MESKTYRIRFITPCFISGAMQEQAEIRPASIRGQLQWWFRLMEFTSEEMLSLFGGISKGDKGAIASAVVIRVDNIKLGNAVRVLPEMKIGAHLSYILHFANASGKQKGEPFGPRFRNNGFIPPESTFEMTVIIKRRISKELRERFYKGLETFLRLGALGFRSSRACGNFQCMDLKQMDFDDFNLWSDNTGVKNIKFLFPAINDSDNELLVPDGTPDSWKNALSVLEFALKDLRESYPAEKDGSGLTPLGCAGNRSIKIDRQASALRLRIASITKSGKPYLLPLLYYVPDILDKNIIQKNMSFYDDIAARQFNINGKDCYLKFYE